MVVESLKVGWMSGLKSVFDRFALRPDINISPPDFPSVLAPYRGIFDHYGISCKSLNPEDKVSVIRTRDGFLHIYWGSRVIEPPLGYYSSYRLNR